MMKYIISIYLISLSFLLYSQNNPFNKLRSKKVINSNFDNDIKPAAEQLKKYLPFITGKRLGMVVNQTSVIANTHLVVTLIKLGCDIKIIFAPEHGFRGNADRGEHINDGIDSKTGVKIVSLYGKNMKPGPEFLNQLDLVIFDIQDVGVRFYTFTSTMTYMMESCARNKVPLLILDRPNPLGHCVSGPVIENELKSFVGLHSVPIVHGLTTAEYALMINNEGWLPDGLKCELHYEKCENYNHCKMYALPIKPSPNLPNMHSIYLYPFEGTNVSVGRGTNKQFQVYGHPEYKKGNYSFTPKPGPGAKNPVLNGEKCIGYDLSSLEISQLQKSECFDLTYLVDFYNNLNDDGKSKMFNKNNFFEKLIGRSDIRELIIAGKSASEIKKTWEKELSDYKILRKKYLIYPE